jgi:hypothetical protein
MTGCIVHRVVKASSYLDLDVDNALARMAAAKGMTKAALLRDVLRKAVVVAPRPCAAGVFEGPGDLARNADDYLAQAGFGEH